jgi:hypothetical protein
MAGIQNNHHGAMMMLCFSANASLTKYTISVYILSIKRFINRNGGRKIIDPGMLVSKSDSINIIFCFMGNESFGKW